jgi:hypothetical protein
LCRRPQWVCSRREDSVDMSLAIVEFQRLGEVSCHSPPNQNHQAVYPSQVSMVTGAHSYGIKVCCPEGGTSCYINLSVLVLSQISGSKTLLTPSSNYSMNTESKSCQIRNVDGVVTKDRLHEEVSRMDIKAIFVSVFHVLVLMPHSPCENYLPCVGKLGLGSHARLNESSRPG